MRRGRGILIGILLFLFVGLSFNAYACLVPIFGAGDSMMAGGCATPEDQPVRQFCDTFKTLGVHAPTEAPKVFDSELFSWDQHASLSLLSKPLRTSRRLIDFLEAPSRDLIIKTTILRI